MLLLVLVTAGMSIHYVNDWLIVLAIALFLVMVVMSIFSRMLVATKFRDGQLWVRGTGKAFRASLPDKP